MWDVSGPFYLCSLSKAVMTKTVTIASSPPKVNPSSVHFHFTERASHSIIQRSASESQKLFEKGGMRSWIHGEGELIVYLQYIRFFEVFDKFKEDGQLDRDKWEYQSLDYSDWGFPRI